MSAHMRFYSHVNYSVTKMVTIDLYAVFGFYSHVNYSVTKIDTDFSEKDMGFTVT